MFHRRQYAMVMSVFLQCVPHYTGLTTRPPRHLHVSLAFLSRPTRGGIGAGGFNTDAGGVVGVGVGACGAVDGARDGAATGTDFDMGT